jgi:hypothetical protein
MTKQQRILKTVAVAVLMALVAVACGGGSDEGAAGETSQQGVSFDGEDTGTDPAPFATTAPIPLATEGEAEPTAAAAPASVSNDDEDPWMVDVLHVNDDVVLIPTFDAPDGRQTTIYDINPIDVIELEYPLLAETAFGNRLALLVEEFDNSGNWAKVLLPVRPNGSTAWVQTAFFSQESHNYHITIDVSENSVNVYKGEELLVEQIAVSGRDSRPTPVVRAYIDEKIAGASLSPAYGDWVLSIAAFSEALGTFGGGMPKLALHGTNQPELMGQYVSSGCVRIPNEVVSFIAESVPVGTIVDIIA